MTTMPSMSHTFWLSHDAQRKECICEYLLKLPYYYQHEHVCKIYRLTETSLIARFMGSTWGPSGADRSQVGPKLAPWTLLFGILSFHAFPNVIQSVEKISMIFPSVFKLLIKKSYFNVDPLMPNMHHWMLKNILSNISHTNIWWFNYRVYPRRFANGFAFFKLRHSNRFAWFVYLCSWAFLHHHWGNRVIAPVLVEWNDVCGWHEPHQVIKLCES